jgi:hypothetical protein
MRTIRAWARLSHHRRRTIEEWSCVIVSLRAEVNPMAEQIEETAAPETDPLEPEEQAADAEETEGATPEGNDGEGKDEGNDDAEDEGDDDAEDAEDEGEESAE